MLKEIILSLQKEMVLMLMAVMLSIILIGSSYLYWQSVSEEKRSVESAYLLISNKYETARERKRLIDQFDERFAELTKVGIIGMEQRLSWITVIDSEVRRNKVSYVKYKINKQEVVQDKALITKYPGIDIFVSKMDLNMQLLHEGDLFRLMNALENKAKGLFDITSCKITRNTQSGSLLIEHSGTDKNFKADCVLNWYTFRAKGA